jgi:hypothetical protein
MLNRFFFRKNIGETRGARNRLGWSKLHAANRPISKASISRLFACEPIGKTALDLGIITSLDTVHSADR